MRHIENRVRLLAFIQALQALLAGQRDPQLAAAPGLHYTMSAESLLLIETLTDEISPGP